jgi:hypothetical protein
VGCKTKREKTITCRARWKTESERTITSDGGACKTKRNRTRANAPVQCADITFAADGDPEIPNVNQTNCFNSTQPDQHIGFQMVYTTTAAAPLARHINPFVALLAPLALMAAGALAWL